MVYVSRATQPLDEDAMVALCAQASRNNAAVEITGALTTDGQRFIQALEGPREVVEDTFIRIVTDPRHTDLLLVSRRVTVGREFGPWAMARNDCIDRHDEMIRRVRDLAKNAPGDINEVFLEMMGGSAIL